MYERFTDRSRKVMQLANQEAQRCNHDFIDAEHILVGVLKENSGVASNVLRTLDIDPTKMMRAVRDQMKEGPGMVTIAPVMPKAEK